MKLKNQTSTLILNAHLVCRFIAELGILACLLALRSSITSSFLEFMYEFNKSIATHLYSFEFDKFLYVAPL